MLHRHKYYRKFRHIVSDPLNKVIPRVEGAGNLSNDGYVILYNGLKILPNSYCNDKASDIFYINQGIYEPQQQYAFIQIINKIKNSCSNPIMMELGSYVGIYSMTFLQINTNGKCYCIEPDMDKLEVGKKHFIINDMIDRGVFINDKIGLSDNSVDKLITDNNIDKLNVLHSDIQGYEYEMLQGSVKSLSNKLIDYLFISTHNNIIHEQCVEFLKLYDYNVVVSLNIDKSYSDDGFILGCSSNIDQEGMELGNKATGNIMECSRFNRVLKRKLSNVRKQ